jgi:superfamily II DNA or RNA helicase
MIVKERWPELKIAWFVPRTSLQNQAVECAKKNFGVDLMAVNGTETNPCKGKQGFVATMQSLSMDPHTWLDAIIKYGPFVLVCDEFHHARIEGGDEDYEQRQFARWLDLLWDKATVKLALSGTLNTGNTSRIYGIHYDMVPDGYKPVPEKSADIYVRYRRIDALTDGAIVPIRFMDANGKVYVVSSGSTQPEEFQLSGLPNDKVRQGIRAANRLGFGASLVDKAICHMKSCGHQLLLITADRQEARKWAQKIRDEYTLSVGLAISGKAEDEARANNAIQQFRDNKIEILVSVAKVAEGFDHCPCTHLAYLGDIRTELWIEQVFARIWRKSPGKSECWAFVPRDPLMDKVVEEIRKEELAVVPVPIVCGKGGEYHPPLLPVGSVLESITPSYLDEHAARLTIKGDLMRRLVGTPLGLDMEWIDKSVERIMADAPPIVSQKLAQSPREELETKRSQLAGYIATLDEKGSKITMGRPARNLNGTIDYTYHNSWLKRRMGLSREDMTLEQLDNAIQVLLSHV